MRVSSEHQHGPAHNHGRVEVAEEAAVFENGPAQTQTDRDEAPAPTSGTNDVCAPWRLLLVLPSYSQVLL